MPINVRVEADAINAFRLRENLPFIALADRIGVSRTTLYRIMHHPDPATHDRTAHRLRLFCLGHKLLKERA